MLLSARDYGRVQGESRRRENVKKSSLKEKEWLSVPPPPPSPPLSQHQACFEGNASQGYYLWSEEEISEIHQFSLGGSLRLLLLFSRSHTHHGTPGLPHPKWCEKRCWALRSDRVTVTCRCTALFVTVFTEKWWKLYINSNSCSNFCVSIPFARRKCLMSLTPSRVWGLNSHRLSWSFSSTTVFSNPVLSSVRLGNLCFYGTICI